MKPRDVQRGVPARPERRGTPPDIGSVTRVRTPDVLDGDGFTRRRPAARTGTQPGGKMVLFWSIGLGVVAFAIMVGAFFMWLRPQMSRDHSNVVREVEAAEESVRVASHYAAPEEEEAIRLVREALANRDPNEVAKMFRMGTATPQQVIDYCAGAEERDGQFEGFHWLGSLDAGGFPIEGVVVSYRKGHVIQRLGLLTPDANGRWRMDFDAFARTMTPSWSDLLAGGDHGLVRVMAAPDVYFNGPFSDDTRWVSYALSTPDSEELLHGYCKVGSPQAEAMQKLFADGTAITRVTLKINRVKDGESRQFEISDFVIRDWAIPEEPGKG